MSRRRVRLPLVVAVVLAVVVALAAAIVLATRGSDFERAASMLPRGMERVTWTNWAAVRDELDLERGDVLGEDSIVDFLETADPLDLTSVSSTASSAALLDDNLGLNPLATEWELLGQGRDGMVVIFRLDGDTDLEKMSEQFRSAGFGRPAQDPLDGGVWEGGPDVISGLDGLATYQLQNVAFLEDRQLLVASDNPDYLARAVKAARGDADRLEPGELLEKAGEPLTAVALMGDFACEDLSMDHADEGAQALADDQLEDAGDVSPLTGYLVALQPGEAMDVVYTFETDEQAEHDAESRGLLARMQDPGQGIDYDESFDLESSEADGRTVVLRLDVADPSAFPLSNTTQGPVLLAAC